MLRAEQKVLVEYEKGTEKIKNILKSKIGKKNTIILDCKRFRENNQKLVKPYQNPISSL